VTSAGEERAGTSPPSRASCLPGLPAPAPARPGRRVACQTGSAQALTVTLLGARCDRAYVYACSSTSHARLRADAECDRSVRRAACRSPSSPVRSFHIGSPSRGQRSTHPGRHLGWHAICTFAPPRPARELERVAHVQHVNEIHHARRCRSSVVKYSPQRGDLLVLSMEPT